MKSCLFVYPLLFISNLFAQSPNISWERCFGGSLEDWATSVIEASDGSYVMAGFAISSDGDISGHHGIVVDNADVIVVKFNTNGDIVWQKTLGGTRDDKAASIQNTSDGGFIVLGNTYSGEDDVTETSENGDFWLVKLDNSGNIEWEKTLGGTGIDEGCSVKQTSDNGFILVGTTQSNNGDVSGLHLGPNNGSDIWLVKTDSQGNIEWQKCLGGTATEKGYDVVESNDGHFIVLGMSDSTNGDLTLNHGYWDVWLVKLSSNGEMVLQKNFGGSGVEYGHSLDLTEDGGLIFAGRSYSNDGDVLGNHLWYYSSTDYSPDFWVVKLDALWEIEWQKCLGGNDEDFALSIKKTLDDGYIVAGTTRTQNNGDISGSHGSIESWVVKLDENGDTSWTKCLGGNGYDNAFSAIQTSAGKYVIAGNTFSIDGDVSSNRGSADAWIVNLEGDFLDLEDQTNERFCILPNPANEEIRLKNIKAGSSVEIKDLFGRIIYSAIIPNQEDVVGIDKLDQGIYFISVGFKSNISTQKLEIVR